MKENSREFENVVKELLKHLEFEIGSTRLRMGRETIDFFAKKDQIEWAVEVKFYRTRIAQTKLIDSAAAWLYQPLQNDLFNLRAMLIVSCLVPVQYRETFESKYGFVLIDRSDLQFWAQPYPELAQRLSSILEEQNESLISEGRSVDEAIQSLVVRSNSISANNTGKQLCEELKILPTGREAWREFELLCQRILEYLFDPDLTGWYQQKSTVDNSNFYDLVCRVRSTSEFWKFVSTDMKSRYVIFEFKNYKDKISQGQVLTTEKYLMVNAMRRVAIIITRHGKDKGAAYSAQGALRESGKLILMLDQNDICQMLDMKDKGEDPSDFLFDCADDFLLTLPR